MYKYKVSEIFASIDGEGIRAGYPAMFIRLYGCNLKCSFCDSQYACVGKDYVVMSLESILDKCKQFNLTRITLTGGEPLMEPNCKILVDKLCDQGYEVNIETNGSYDISEYITNPNVIVTMDYKCYSSNMTDRMKLSNIKLLRKTDVLKFVVGSRDDLDLMYSIVHLFPDTQASIFVSPVFGKIDPKDIIKYTIDNHLDNVRMQLQLHKIIWNPEMRGV